MRSRRLHGARGQGPMKPTGPCPLGSGGGTCEPRLSEDRAAPFGQLGSSPPRTSRTPVDQGGSRRQRRKGPKDPFFSGTLYGTTLELPPGAATNPPLGNRTARPDPASRRGANPSSSPLQRSLGDRFENERDRRGVVTRDTSPRTENRSSGPIEHLAIPSLCASSRQLPPPAARGALRRMRRGGSIPNRSQESQDERQPNSNTDGSQNRRASQIPPGQLRRLSTPTGRKLPIDCAIERDVQAGRQ